MLHPKWVPLVLVGASLASRAASAQTSPSPVLTPAELFEKVSPCVVKIVAKDEDDRSIGTGSGFVISPNPEAVSDDGLQRWIVTNHHVVRAAVSAAIDPPFTHPVVSPGPSGDFARSTSNVVAENESNDLAVLATFGWDVPHLTLGDDTVPPIGTRVFVISSPEGLKNTLSEGLISGFRERENGKQWIQITAPISSGSSGGPVLTGDGRVIGVVVASHEEGQNLNFAVPVGVLRQLLARPNASRELWRSVSIGKEWDIAIGSAATDFDFEFRQARKEVQDNQPPLSYQDFVARRAAEGYQLAFLLRAYSEIYEKGFPTEAAIADLTAATNAKPGKYDYLAHYYLGYAYYRSWSLSGSGPQSLEKRKRFLERSFEPLRKAISLAPKFSPSHRVLALGYKETERYPDALVAATNLIALVPRCSEAYQIRGQIIADMGSRQGFEDDFKVALDLRPNNAEVLANMANAYSALEDWDAVIEANKKALAAADKQMDSWKAVTWANLGNGYVHKDDCRNALAAFEKSRALGGLQHPFEEHCRQRLKE